MEPRDPIEGEPRSEREPGRPGHPMEIVFSTYDSPGNPYYGGGGATAIQQISRHLVLLGHRVTVVCGSHPGSRPGGQDGVRYLHVGSPSMGPRTGQLMFQALLPAAVRRMNFDVWVESLTPPFSTACLQCFTRRPVAALTQVLAGSDMRRKYFGLPFDRLERAGLRTYRHAIATSTQTLGTLLEANPHLHTAVIPNGVDPVRCIRPLPPASGRRHLLFLGRIDIRQKGLDLLLDAVESAVPGQLPPLLIAGSGTPGDEGWLRTRLQSVGLRERVRWVGRATGAHLDSLFDGALALAMPSRYEAAPLVSVEAGCHGVPVVCFDLPALSDLPGSCTLKVPPFNVNAYAGALARIAGDPAMVERMGTAGKQRSRGLGWDRLAEAYSVFFETLGPAR